MSTQTTTEQELAAALLKAAGDADEKTLRAAFAIVLAQRTSERRAKVKADAAKVPRTQHKGGGSSSDALKEGARASETHHEAVTSYEQARPDLMLAESAQAIAEAEGVDYDAAMRLATERDPLLAFRYGDMASARQRSRGARVDPPKGLRLCECPPDVEVAERAKALADVEGIGYGAAMTRLLAENPKLASRYHDQRMGECALDELAYRVDTLVSANEWRLSERKAVDAVLAEDAVLKASVLAYFERDPYTSPAA